MDLLKLPLSYRTQHAATLYFITTGKIATYDQMHSILDALEEKEVAEESHFVRALVVKMAMEADTVNRNVVADMKEAAGLSRDVPDSQLVISKLGVPELRSVVEAIYASAKK